LIDDIDNFTSLFSTHLAKNILNSNIAFLLPKLCVALVHDRSDINLGYGVERIGAHEIIGHCDASAYLFEAHCIDAMDRCFEPDMVHHTITKLLRQAEFPNTSLRTGHNQAKPGYSPQQVASTLIHVHRVYGFQTCVLEKLSECVYGLHEIMESVQSRFIKAEICCDMSDALATSSALVTFLMHYIQRDFIREVGFYVVICTFKMIELVTKIVCYLYLI